MFVPLIGPTLVHGVLEIHGLLTTELSSALQCRRPVDAVRNMLNRQDYTYVQQARFWKLEKVANYAKIDQPNSSMVMSGRISEVVYSKNGIPFFGGPRFNILWEDGKTDTELTAGELLNIYQETPQSLGSITILDDVVSERLYDYSLKAGSFLETRKTEIFLHQLSRKLRILQLNAVGIVEMILQSIPNIITDIKEIVFIGFNYRFNEMKTLVNHSPIGASAKEAMSNASINASFSLSAFDIAQQMIKEEAAAANKKRRFKSESQQNIDDGRVFTKVDRQSNSMWAGIELRVPEKFQWAKSSDYSRFFFIFQKKLFLNSYVKSPTNQISSTPASPTNRPNSAFLSPPEELLPFDHDVFLGATKQIESKISFIWHLEQRKKGFRETIKQLEGILLENRNLSLKEIYDIFLSNIPQKWLRADIYIGILKSGATQLDYLACNESSKMLGKSLKRGNDGGISFDVIDTGKTLIFNQADLDKKKQLSEGCTIGILYGKKQYMGKLLTHRGHEKYDVIYDFDQKVEPGVDISRIIPLNIAFRIKLFPKAKLPFIVVPVRNRNKCIGVLGVDNIDYECLIDTSLLPSSASTSSAGKGGNNIKSAKQSISADANSVITYAVDEDLQTFLEQLGRLLGSAIDVKLKKNALQSMYTVAKNQNSELKDLFTSALEVIFTCSCYITGMIIYEYLTNNSTSSSKAGKDAGKTNMILLDSKGQLSTEVSNKMKNFDLKRAGKKLLQRVGMKGAILLCIVKSENEAELESRIYVIGISCNAPILDVDYEFFNAFQKTLTGLLHNIITHKASGEYRARALKDIRQLCNQWISNNTSAAPSSTSIASSFSNAAFPPSSSLSIFSPQQRQYFFQKFCERIWKVYHAANLYVGVVGMHANQIKYILASHGSEMAGKMLLRSAEQSVSFLAIDKDRPYCVLAGTPLANQLYHFGEKQSFQYPFVVVPIVADIDTVFGVLGVDNSAGEVVADTAGQLDDLMSFYGTVGLSLGKVIRKFRSDDVREQLKDIRRKAANFNEAIIAVRKVLLEYLPFANRVVDLSFRPYHSKVTTKQELVIYLQVFELQLKLALINAYSAIHGNGNGVFRLFVIYRGHVLGEVRPVNYTSSKSAKIFSSSSPSRVQSNILSVLKIGVPEGISSDNFKILFKLIFTTNSSAVVSTPIAASSSDVISKRINSGSSKSVGGSLRASGILGGGGHKRDQEISQKFLTLHYFYHSQLLPHQHTLYNVETTIKDSTTFIEAEVANFQIKAKLEDAQHPVAILLTSASLKLEFSTNITKLSSDYEIYIIFIYNSQNLGRTEKAPSLDTRLEWNELDTFLTLPAIFEGNNSNNVTLDLEVWSTSLKTKEDLLGKMSFTVSNLLSHLTSSEDDLRIQAAGFKSKKAVSHNVQRNIDCLSFINNLSLQLNGKTILARDVEQEQIPFLLKTSDHSTTSNLIPLQIQKSIKNLDNFIQCEISILQIRDLVLLQRFASMSTYFTVFLNNAEIGSTSISYDPIQPNWKEEYFRLLIPTGPEWADFVLTLDLYGMIGNSTDALLIGKVTIKSVLLAEALLSGLMKFIWFDLILYNDEAFELENLTRSFSPQVLMSARILSASKVLEGLSFPMTKELKMIDFVEFINLPNQFFESQMNQIIGYFENKKIIELKLSSTGSWVGKVRQFRLPANKSLLQCNFRLEFHKKISNRSSFVQQSLEQLVLGKVELTGVELYRALFPFPLPFEEAAVAAGVMVHRYLPIPESVYPSLGKAMIKLRTGHADSSLIYEYDFYTVTIKVLAAQGIPIEKIKFATNLDNRPNCQCFLLWNNEHLGTTELIPHSQNPVWDQKDSFFFRVPKDLVEEERLAKCKLTMEVYQIASHYNTDFDITKSLSKKISDLNTDQNTSEMINDDKTNQKVYDYDEVTRTLLGRVELKGIDLENFFTNETEFIPWYPLEIIEPFNSDVAYASAEQYPSMKLFGAIVNDLKNPSRKAINDLEYMVQILQAEGLANTDAFGSANAYVEIIYDGKVIAFTQAKKGTMNPKYSNERFFVDFTDLDQAPHRMYLRVWSLFPAKPRAFLGEITLNQEEIKEIIHSPEYDRTIHRPLLRSNEMTEEENSFVQGTIHFRFLCLMYDTSLYETSLTEPAYLQLCSISNIPRSSLLNTVPKIYVRVLRKYILEGKEWINLYHSPVGYQSFTVDFDQIFIPIAIPLRAIWTGFEIRIEVLNEMQEVIAFISLFDDTARHLLCREGEDTFEAMIFPLQILDSYAAFDAENLTEISLRGGKSEYLEDMKEYSLSMLDSEESLLVSGKLLAFDLIQLVLMNSKSNHLVPIRPSTMIIKKGKNKIKTVNLRFDDEDKLLRTEVILPNMNTIEQLEFLFYSKDVFGESNTEKSVPLAVAPVPFSVMKDALFENGEYDIILKSFVGKEDVITENESGGNPSVPRDIGRIKLSRALMERGLSHMSSASVEETLMEEQSEKFSLRSFSEDGAMQISNDVPPLLFLLRLDAIKVIPKKENGAKPVNVYATLDWFQDSLTTPIGQTAVMKETVLFLFDNERFQTMIPSLQTLNLSIQVFMKNQITSDTLLGKSMISSVELVELFQEGRSQTISLVLDLQVGAVSNLGWKEAAVALSLNKIPNLQSSIYFNPAIPIQENNANHVEEIELVILGFSGLAKLGLMMNTTDCFATVRYGYSHLGETSIVHDSSNPIWFENQAFSFRFPASAVVIEDENKEDYQIIIDVYCFQGSRGPTTVSSAPNTSKHAYLGSIVLLFEELNQIFQDTEMECFYLDRPLIFDNVRRKQSEGRNVQGHGYLSFVRRGIDGVEGRDASLQIFGARGLLSLLPAGSAVLNTYAVVRWNSSIIGITSICKASMSPIWENDRFSIHISDIEALKACYLTIELWQSKASTILVADLTSNERKKDLLLGHIKLSRSELVSVFDEGTNQNITRWMPLQTPCPYLPGVIQVPASKSASIHADAAIEIKCSFIGSGGKFSLKQHRSFNIHLHKIENLYPVDGSGQNLNVYVICRLNEREIGRSYLISKTNNPQWENQSFSLQLPEETISQSLLQLEVMNQRGGLLLSPDDFLGVVSLRDISLSNLLLNHQNSSQKHSLPLLDENRLYSNRRRFIQGEMELSVTAGLDEGFREGDDINSPGLMLTSFINSSRKDLQYNWKDFLDSAAGNPILMCEVAYISLIPQMKALVTGFNVQPIGNVLYGDNPMLSLNGPYPLVSMLGKGFQNARDTPSTPSSSPGFFHQYSWKGNQFSVYYPISTDFQKSALHFEFWNETKASIVSAALGASNRFKIGEVHLSFDVLLNLFYGEYSFPLTLHADVASLLWKGNVFIRFKTIFPFWNSCDIIRPTSYRRRITVASANNLPLINGAPPNSRATILINGIAIAKSALVQNNINPTYTRLSTDLDIDILEEISVSVEIYHVNTWNRKEVLLGGEEIPYEYLVKPPSEALHAFLRNDQKRDQDYQFALSGSVKVIVQGSNRLEEDLFGYAVRKSLHSVKQAKVKIVPTEDSESNTPYPLMGGNDNNSNSTSHGMIETSLVKVLKLDFREKTKKSKDLATIDKPIKTGAISEEDLNNFGMITNLTTSQETFLNPQWMVLPVMDIGMSVGNPKKKTNFVGTLPGNLLSFAIERRSDRLAVSDIPILEDIEYDIAATLVHVRRRDLARKQREKASTLFQEFVGKMNSLPIQHYDERKLWNMLKMILTICFPYSAIRLVRISKDFSTLFYENIQVSSFSSSSMEDNKNQNSEISQIVRIPREYSQKDGNSFGRNFQRSFSIHNPGDLFRQNLLLFHPNILQQPFPRITSHICAEDAVTSLLQIENFLIHQGGNQLPMHHIEIEEIQKWLEEMTMSLGESAFQYKEKIVIEKLHDYFKQWNSSLIGSYCMILSEVQKILFGYRLLEVINIDAEYRLHSLVTKKPKTEQIYGRKVVIKKIHIRRKIDEAQSVISGTSAVQSMTSSIKNFLGGILGGTSPSVLSAEAEPTNTTTVSGTAQASSFGNVWKAAKKLFANANEEENEKDILDKILEEADENSTTGSMLARRQSVKDASLERMDSIDEANPEDVQITEITNLVCGIRYDNMEQIFPIKHDTSNNAFSISSDITLYIKSDYQVIVSVYEIGEDGFQPICECSGMLYLSLSQNKLEDYATETKVILSPVSYPMINASKRAARTSYEFCYEWEWDENFSQSQQSYQIDDLDGIRLKLIKASQLSILKNKKLPNPFCQVLYQDKVIATTAIVTNSVSPEWNESVYISINADSLALTNKNVNSGGLSKNRIMIDCYDGTNSRIVGNKGQFLGRVSLTVDQLLSYTATSANSSDSGTLLELGLEPRKDMKPNKQKFVGGKLSLTCKAVFKADGKKGGVLNERNTNFPANAIGEKIGGALKNSDPTAAMFAQINQMKNPHLIITIDSAMDLPSANRFSNDSDPFVVIFVGKEEISRGKTKTISNTLNPIWDESFEFSLLTAKQNQHDIKPEEIARLRELSFNIQEEKDSQARNNVTDSGSKSKKDKSKPAASHISTANEAVMEFFNTNIIEQSASKNYLGSNGTGTSKDAKQSLFLSDRHFNSISDLPNIRFEVYDYNQFTSSVLLGKCELSPQLYLLPPNSNTGGEMHREASTSVFATSGKQVGTKDSLINKEGPDFQEINIPSNEITLNISGFKSDFKNYRGKLAIKCKIIDLPLHDDNENSEDEGEYNANSFAKKKQQTASAGLSLNSNFTRRRKYCFNEYNGLSSMTYIEINLFKINEIARSKDGRNKNRGKSGAVSSMSSFFGFSSKINSYIIIKFQHKIIHQTKLILNNPSPEFNEKCAFLFNYDAIYTQIIGLATSNLSRSRQNSLYSGGTLKRKESVLSADSSNTGIHTQSVAVAENVLNGLDVTMELWLTDYFNNHECLGEFYLPASQLLHATNYEIFNLELIQKDEIKEATQDTEKNGTEEVKKDVVTQENDKIDDKIGDESESTLPTKRGSSFFSLTKQREKEKSKRQQKNHKIELSLMINRYRKFPEVYINKRKFYPIFHQYERIVQQYLSSTTASDSSPTQSSIPQQFSLLSSGPSAVLAGKPIIMIYDPQLEASRLKKDQMASSVINNLVEKSNQQIYKYYHTSPFEQIGVISELHYGQICAASRRGEKTILKGPKMDIFCLPLFPTRQQLQQQAQQLQQMSLDISTIASSSLLTGGANLVGSSGIVGSSSSNLNMMHSKTRRDRKDLRKNDAKALEDENLLKIDNQLFKPGGKLDEEDEDEDEGDENKSNRDEDSNTIFSASTNVESSLSPTLLAMKEMAQQFYQKNHIYLVARYPKDQLPRKHIKYLEKLQTVMLSKMENIFFLRYAKQKQLISLYDNMKSFSGMASASLASNHSNSKAHHPTHHHVKLEEMIIQSMLEFETSTDCPIKLYLLAENGVDFSPVTLDTYYNADGDGEISLQTKKSISTRHRNQPNHRNRYSQQNMSDKYDLIAKIILICRYQIIIQYYNNEISIVKSHWEHHLPNDLPQDIDVIEELNKLFAGNYFQTLFSNENQSKQTVPTSNRNNNTSASEHSSLKYKYSFQNDYYQQFYQTSSHFFEDVFREIREQYPNGVLFLPLLAFNEVMMGLLIIKNINSSFPKVEYHYSVPEEYLQFEPSYNQNKGENNKKRTPTKQTSQDKKVIRTTETNEKIFTLESMEHGILPIINKSSQLFSENIFLTKIDNVLRTIKSFSIKGKTNPKRFLSFCFWQIVQSIPAIREVSIWMIHRNHIFVERQEYLSNINSHPANSASSSIINSNAMEGIKNILIPDEKEKRNIQIDDDQDDSDGEEKEETEKVNDPFSFLAKLFKFKNNASKEKNVKKNKKKSRFNRRVGNRSSKVNLAITTQQRLEGILAGFFGSENASDLLQLEHIKQYRANASSKNNQKDLSRRLGGGLMPNKAVGEDSKADWKIDVPEVFLQYSDENIANEKLMNKFFLEKIYREIIYCIENQGLTTFSTMTGHSLAVIGKDSLAIQEMFTHQIFQLPSQTRSIPSERPTGLVTVKSMTTAVSGLTNPFSFSEVEEDVEEGAEMNRGISQNTIGSQYSATSNLSKANSVGLKKPPLPPGPPPSYANRVAAINLADNKNQSNSFSPYISPRPPQQPPPGQSFTLADDKDSVVISNEGEKEVDIGRASNFLKTNSVDSRDVKSVTAEQTVDTGAPSLNLEKDRFYFCLSVKTHGKDVFRFFECRN